MTDYYNLMSDIEDLIAEGTEKLITLFSDSETNYLDINNLKAILRESATFSIGRGYWIEDDRVPKALKDALASPLMKRCDLKSSKKCRS